MLHCLIPAYVIIFSTIYSYLYLYMSTRVYIASIIVPIFVYLYMYDSEGVNERAYVLKRIRIKGLRRMITFLYRSMTTLGNKLIEHTDSVSTRHSGRAQDKLNIRRPSRTPTLLAIVLSALAYQAKKTHWEQ